jgi:hypothetical protein
MSRILGIVHSCNTCPKKQYYSGGTYECIAIGTVIDSDTLKNGYIAEWCPLPPHPANEFEVMRKELNKLRAAKEES